MRASAIDLSVGILPDTLDLGLSIKVDYFFNEEVFRGYI